MPRRVQGPDGKVHEFPDDFSDAEIASALDSLLPPAQPTKPQGSATSRFASNAWEMLNPVEMVKGVWNTLPIPEAVGGAGVTAPIETGKAILASHGNQLEKAKKAFSEGRYSEALGHTAATALPILGPLAADAGEQIGSGDVAGGLGKTAGLVVPFGMIEGLRALGVRATPTRVANALDAKAASNVADVMSPKSSSAKGLRMTAKAEKIAPELLKDDAVGGFSRGSLQQRIASKLADARAALDEADDARNPGAPIETKPILEALKKKRAALEARPFEASRPDVQALDKGGVPVGTAKTPSPNKARAAVLDQAIREVEALGEIAPYDALRTIRKAYDGPAEVVYNPAVTPDFLTNAAKSRAAADVTGAIRDVLASADPVTAAANADFSLYKNAADIIQAAEELEKARPKVGRQIMARLTASLFGGQAAGAPGAAAGILAGPTMDAVLNSGFTTKLQTAKVLSEMADAIRTGNQTKFFQLDFDLRKNVRALANKKAATGRGVEATRERQSPTGQPLAQ